MPFGRAPFGRFQPFALRQVATSVCRPTPRSQSKKKNMVYAISLGKQGNMVYTIGTEGGIHSSRRMLHHIFVFGINYPKYFQLQENMYRELISRKLHIKDSFEFGELHGKMVWELFSWKISFQLHKIAIISGWSVYTIEASDPETEKDEGFHGHWWCILFLFRGIRHFFMIKFMSRKRCIWQTVGFA